MRYTNWDVLLFPEGSKIPIQEFKTECSVVHDAEFAPTRDTPCLVPTITSFTPSLPSNTRFRVSVHCWINPRPSKYLRSRLQSTDNTAFEVRVLIDGKHWTTKIISASGPWPTIIDTYVTRRGDYAPLKFPAFNPEILKQSYWNAGDDMGRIKVLIAEGFHHEAPHGPFERIKNITCFSFQHAPLEILESSGIAWPNEKMWKISTSNNRSPAQEQVATDHSHSPRRESTGSGQSMMPPPSMRLGSGNSTYSQTTTHDPFTESSLHWRQSSDTSMPDYNTYAAYGSRSTSGSTYEQNNRRHESLQSVGAFESICEALLPSAPTNTPRSSAALSVNVSTTVTRASSQSTSLVNAAKGTEEIEALSKPLVLTPRQVKSKKEGTQSSPQNLESSFNTPLSEISQRRIIRPLADCNSGGNKRPRVPTPSKVIDLEDDAAYGSPNTRRVSSNHIGQRHVLSGLPNNTVVE